MDLPTVRAEIKEWERSFKASNGRDPTVEEIKAQPLIADKYKLYKKLSKSAPRISNKPMPSTSTHVSSDPPSTPPRTRPRAAQAALLLSKPRTLEVTASLSSFNPFSPQKNKGKQPVHPSRKPESRANPFISPVKSRPNVATQRRETSPDPFPILFPQQRGKALVSPLCSPAPPTSAVSRARKRLRGEPVSPSPSKEKRRRIGSQTKLPFTTLAPDSSDEDDGEDEEDLFFISDSPVKALPGSKSFKLLFDETSAPAKIGPFGPHKARAPTGNTGTVSSGRLFGERSALSNLEDTDWEMGGRALDTMKGKVSTSRPFGGGYANEIRTNAISQASQPANKSPSDRISSKRSLSDIEMEAPDPKEPIDVGQYLLPPSPRQADPSTYKSKESAAAKGKGKAKAKPDIKRKKARITDNHGPDTNTDESDIPVKVVDRAQALRSKYTGEEDFDTDPLRYIRRTTPYANVNRGPEMGKVDKGGAGKFEVYITDTLQRVLALESAEPNARDSREERTVKGLLSGQRSSHYDPIKGGEIWDVGEDDIRVDEEGTTRRDTEGEDDWEGEPVPWEAGEL